MMVMVVVGTAGEVRTWTAGDGRTLEGEMVRAGDGKVMVRRSDGRTFELGLEGLSEADRAYVAARENDAVRAKGFEEGKYAEAVTGEWVKYGKEGHGLVWQLFVGKELKRKTKDGVEWPLFVNLHGAAGRADDVEVGKVEIAAKRLVRPEQYGETPAVVCVPLCPPDTFWGNHAEKLEAIIDDLVGNLPIDRKRIYLSGYSMGGGGVATLLGRRPEAYAAAMMADGTVKDDWAGKVKAGLYLFYSGERDSSKIEGIKGDFEKAGGALHYEVFPEVEHNGIHWKLAHDEEVFGWVFGKRLE